MWCCEHNLKCHWKWLRWIPLKMSTFLFTSKKAMKPAPDVFLDKKQKSGSWGGRQTQCLPPTPTSHIGHDKHRGSKPPQRTILENCAKGNADINIDTRQTNYYSWSQVVVKFRFFNLIQFWFIHFFLKGGITTIVGPLMTTLAASCQIGHKYRSILVFVDPYVSPN